MKKSFKKIHHDESGVIMITVLVLVLVLSVVAVGILGINISQVSTSSSVVENIRAEQLAIGAFYRYHQQQAEGLAGALPATEVIDGKTYTINIQNNGNLGGTTPNSTNEIEVTVGFGG